MEDAETKLMQKELDEYYALERKEMMKKNLEEMRRKYKKKAPPEMKDRLEAIEKQARSAGFVVDKSREQRRQK